MLALTRKRGESIIIADNIEVVVLGFSGEQVKIGVQAPREISIHRKEVYDQIQLENQMAAETSSDSYQAIKKMLNNNRN